MKTTLHSLILCLVLALCALARLSAQDAAPKPAPISLLGPQAPADLATRQAQAAQAVVRAARANYSHLLRMQREGLRLVWAHPQLSPQQVCDGLGTAAGRAFDLHAALTAAIIELAQIDGIVPAVGLPTWAFTRHEDGTVQIHEGTPYGTPVPADPEPAPDPQPEGGGE